MYLDVNAVTDLHSIALVALCRACIAFTDFFRHSTVERVEMVAVCLRGLDWRCKGRHLGGVLILDAGA